MGDDKRSRCIIWTGRTRISSSCGGIIMEEQIQKLIDDFNERAKTDEKLKESLKGKVRSVLITFTDGESYNFRLEECQLVDFKVGALGKADIMVTSDMATFQAILNKEISPLKAYASKKIKFKASLSDLLTLKKFF